MRNTCEKYSEIKVPYKHRETITNLSNNQNIAIMKQDKGRGIVIIDRNKYFDKYLALLNSEKFVILKIQDPTATTERKVQQILRKIKQKLPNEVYQKLYPTGLSPGKFYGTAKIHKLQPNQGIDELPLDQ